MTLDPQALLDEVMAAHSSLEGKHRDAFAPDCLKGKELQIRQLVKLVTNILVAQPMLLEVDCRGDDEADVVVVGNVKSDIKALVRALRMAGDPRGCPKRHYLFLGGYTTWATHGIDCLVVLMAYKVLYPHRVHLLRGKSEIACLSRTHGVYDECKRRFNVKLWKTFIGMFNVLPVAAVVNERIFAAAGGISPLMFSDPALQDRGALLNAIRSFPHPTFIPESGLLCDLIWAEVTDEAKGWAEGNSGVSLAFTSQVADDFCAKFGFELICRSSVVRPGYEFLGDDKRVVTLFATACNDDYGSRAGMMFTTSDLRCTLAVFNA